MDWITSIEPNILLWLVLLIVFIVGEFISVGLVSIWFAAGALAAVILAGCQVDFSIQIIVFFMVSGILLWFTRPWAQKFVNAKMQKTNVDSVIGEKVYVTERVSNLDQTGKAVVRGQEWTVRADDDTQTFGKGELVEVVRVSGVKLLVKRVEKKEE